jgi:hypothetical protein
LCHKIKVAQNVENFWDLKKYNFFNIHILNISMMGSPGNFFGNNKVPYSKMNMGDFSQKYICQDLSELQPKTNIGVANFQSSLG